MTRNSARKKAARALAAEKGSSYTHALRHLSETPHGAITVRISGRNRAGFLLKQDGCSSVLALHAECPCESDECLGIILPFEADLKGRQLRTLEPDSYVLPMDLTPEGLCLDEKAAFELRAVLDREFSDDFPGLAEEAAAWKRLYANSDFRSWKEGNPTEVVEPTPRAWKQWVSQVQDHLVKELGLTGVRVREMDTRKDQDGSVVCAVQTIDKAATTRGFETAGWAVKSATKDELARCEDRADSPLWEALRVFPTTEPRKLVTLDELASSLPREEDGWVSLTVGTATVLAALINRFLDQEERAQVTVTTQGVTRTVEQESSFLPSKVITTFDEDAYNHIWTLNRDAGTPHLEMRLPVEGRSSGYFKVTATSIEGTGKMFEPRAYGGPVADPIPGVGRMEYPADVTWSVHR